MAKILRDIISELATDVKALNLDDRISYRYLLFKFNSKIEYFLRLEAKSREFAKLQNIWKPINCVELIDVGNNSCQILDHCNTLKRSKDIIPEAFGTNYGLLMKVLTIDSKSEFKLITNSSEYEDYRNRLYVGDRIRAVYLENKYLYIPNIDYDSVKILLIPKDPYAVDVLNGALTACSSPLDATVSYPEYLIKLAKEAALQEIAGVYKRVVSDENPNDNTNIKS